MQTILALRIAMMFLTLLAAAGLIVSTQAYVAIVLTGAAALYQAVALYRHMEQGHRQMAQFIEAVEHDDFSRHVVTAGRDPSLALLATALTRAADRLRTSRAEQAAQAAALKGLLEHLPVAVLTREPDGRLIVANSAARVLFERGLPDDGAEYGAAFHEALDDIAAGESRLVPMTGPATSIQVKVTASDVTMHGQTRRILSVENIQSELDATELKAWHDLVRVLTHEMMNSLTPVSSLAGTVKTMIDDMAARLPKDDPAAGTDLTDIGDAVDTIGRRSEGLLHFVQGYRRLTRVPAPTRQRFQVEDVFGRLHHLMAPDFAKRNIVFRSAVTPNGLLLNADPELLEQALINLVRNAADALDETGGEITLSATLDSAGAVAVTVRDTGPGIPPDIAGQIFVPFFTTKASGSGVGLSITKQVMSAHGGTVDLASPDRGGALFTLRFP